MRPPGPSATLKRGTRPGRAMPRFLLLVFLAAAVALAGCQEAANDLTDNEDAPPAQVTNEQARAMLTEAGQNMPDKFGMKMSLTKNGQELMAMDGAFDNTTETAYMEIKVDPAIADQGGEDGGDAEDLAALVQNGLTLYMTPEGVVYIINDTAFAFPAGEEGEDSFVPSPEETPFGEFLDPTEAFGDIDENVTVTSVRPITYKGKAAYEIQATLRGEEDEATNGTFTVYASPKRLAKIEADMPEGEDASDPLSGGHAVVDLLYDDEVDIKVPERATRAAALRYDGGGFDFGGGSDDGKTWTFQASPGTVPLGEVEAQVKDVSSMGDEAGGPDSFSRAPTLWSMKLTEGTKTQDGVTLTFTDADNDGKVSMGDTLRITGEDANGMPPQVALYDTKTGTYVIPGAGLLLVALALAGAAALAGAMRGRAQK